MTHKTKNDSYVEELRRELERLSLDAVEGDETAIQRSRKHLPPSVPLRSPAASIGDCNPTVSSYSIFSMLFPGLYTS